MRYNFLLQNAFPSLEGKVKSKTKACPPPLFFMQYKSFFQLGMWLSLELWKIRLLNEELTLRYLPVKITSDCVKITKSKGSYCHIYLFTWAAIHAEGLHFKRSRIWFMFFFLQRKISLSSFLYFLVKAKVFYWWGFVLHYLLFLCALNNASRLINEDSGLVLVLYLLFLFNKSSKEHLLIVKQ